MSDLAYIRWKLARDLDDFKRGIATAEEILAGIEALIDAKQAATDKSSATPDREADRE